MIKVKDKPKAKRYLLNFVDDEREIETRKKLTQRELNRLLKVTRSQKR
jgi:hypothetical protein